MRQQNAAKNNSQGNSKVQLNNEDLHASGTHYIMKIPSRFSTTTTSTTSTQAPNVINR